MIGKNVSTVDYSFPIPFNEFILQSIIIISFSMEKNLLEMKERIHSEHDDQLIILESLVQSC